MNIRNSKTSYPHELLHNLTDKIHLIKGRKSVALSTFGIWYT